MVFEKAMPNVFFRFVSRGAPFSALRFKVDPFPNQILTRETVIEDALFSLFDEGLLWVLASIELIALFVRFGEGLSKRHLRIDAKIEFHLLAVFLVTQDKIAGNATVF